jgi:hypothetical protein
MEVKPKIVASHGFFPTCDMKNIESHFAKHFRKWL